MTILNNVAVTVVTIVGLMVLIGVGQVSSSDGLPIIAALAGVHIGTNRAATVVARNQPPYPPPNA